MKKLNDGTSFRLIALVLLLVVSQLAVFSQTMVNETGFSEDYSGNDSIEMATIEMTTDPDQEIDYLYACNFELPASQVACYKKQLKGMDDSELLQMLIIDEAVEDEMEIEEWMIKLDNWALNEKDL